MTPFMHVAQRIGAWPVHHARAAMAVLVLLGVAGMAMGARIPLNRLGLPSTTVLDVHAELPGIDAVTVETAVTKPLEHALAAMPGLDDMESHSRHGGADVFLRFAGSVDREGARAAARKLVERSAARLPRGMDLPSVSFGGAAIPPAAIYLVRAPALSQDLVRWVRSVLVDPLREVPEIASVRIVGLDRHEIRIQPDPRRLAALGLSFDDLIETVRRRDAAPRRKSTRTQVVTPASADAIAARAVRLPNGEPVPLSDVASVSLVVHPAETDMHYNGARPLRIIIYPRSLADSVRAADRAQAHLAWLRANRLIPAGASIHMQHNESRALTNWLKHVLLVVGGAAAVIFAVVGLVLGVRAVAGIALAFVVWAVLALAVLAGIGQTLNAATPIGLMLAAAPLCAMLVSRLAAAALRRVAIVGALAWVAGVVLAPATQVSMAFAAGLVAAAAVRWLITPWLHRAHILPAPGDAAAPARASRRPTAAGVAAVLMLAAIGSCVYALSAVGADAQSGIFSFRLRGPDPQRLRAIVDPMMVSLHVFANVEAVTSSTQRRDTWRLQLDPQRMEAAGIGLAAVGRAFAIAREGLIVGDVMDADERVALRLQLAPNAAGDAYAHLLLRGESGRRPAIYLYHVGTAVNVSAPRERVRVNGEPAVKITAHWHGPGAREALQDFCDRVDVPDGYRLECAFRAAPV